MPEKSQHELALELAALARQADKVRREIRPVDQVANINFLIKVTSKQS